MTVDSTLRIHAKRQPNKAAVRTADRSITYAELHTSVTCLARHLLDRGLRPGDRVAVHWSNSIETVQLLLAAFRAGLIAVPINLRLKSPEIAYIFEHCAVRICFSEPALAAVAAEARSGSDFEIVTQLPAVTANPGPLPEIDPAQPAVILYTSGTTARPKGVTHTHRSLLATALIWVSIPIGPDDTLLPVTQLTHASGLDHLLVALHQGATLVVLRAFDPATALDLIERFRCTGVWGLPAMLQFVVEEQVQRRRHLSIRNAGAGGDTVPAALQRRFQEVFAVQLREGYALTESCPVTFNRVAEVRVGSIGPTAPGVDVRLVDRHGHDVPKGETGEILVRSPANCVGYWNDPDATARLFEDGWLRTGDLASRDEDGYYWFKGRLKQIIIRGGSNVSPQEVEEALHQHPAVLEAGVVGAPHSVYGEVPVASVVLRAGHSVNEDQLRAHARKLLADYKVPERILFLRELPKGLTGKVDRRSLRDILIAQSDLLKQLVVPGI